MLNAELLNQCWREYARCKCSTEDGAEFLVKTTDTHLFKLEIGRDDGIRCTSSNGEYNQWSTVSLGLQDSLLRT